MLVSFNHCIFNLSAFKAVSQGSQHLHCWIFSPLRGIISIFTASMKCAAGKPLRTMSVISSICLLSALKCSCDCVQVVQQDVMQSSLQEQQVFVLICLNVCNNKLCHNHWNTACDIECYVMQWRRFIDLCCVAPHGT